MEEKCYKLNKLITETYIPEDFTRRLVTETVENQLSNLGKIINNLKSSLEAQIDELYFNHVAVPGLINHTLPPVHEFEENRSVVMK